MKAAFLIALAVCAIPVGAQAESWRRTAWTSEFPGLVYFVDVSSIRRAGDIAEYTVMNYREADGVEPDMTSIIRMRANCASRETQFLSIKDYVDGKLQGETTRPSAWSETAADSLGEADIFAACGVGEYETDIVADPVQHAKELMANATRIDGR